nr:cytochrome P450 4AV17 [Meteorus pulchricornis]
MELGLVDFSIAFVAIGLGFYYWATSTFSYWKNLGVPGPSPTPFLGNAAPVLTHKKSLPEMIKDLTDEWKHEPFFGIFNGRMPALIVTDLDLIKNILIKDFHAFPGRGLVIDEEDDPLEAHLFNLDGHRWKVLRSKQSPAFTSGKLRQMVDLIVECSHNFEKYLSEEVAINNVIDCHEFAARFTTDVIGSCAFGINMSALEKKDSKFREIGRAMFRPTFGNLLEKMLRVIAPRLRKFLGLKALAPEYTKFFIGTIKETMEYREKNNILRHDFVDILRDLKNNHEDIDFELTEALLASQAFLFFTAGFETASTAISFALYELATVPETQERLRAEIMEVLDKHNGRLSYDIVNEMKYLDMVLQETLRKDPPAIAIRRTVSIPYKIPGYDVTLPKDTMIIIPVYSIHHDERYYPNPDVFDPERFSKENNNRHPMVYLPFGHGPKNCIGSRFALHQSKLGIIAVIKNFRVTPSASTVVPYEIDKSSLFLTAANGNHLKFEPV